MPALEKTYKTLGSSISLFISSFISILKIAFMYRINKKLPKAIKTSCAVLGNGPSLNDSFENHLNFIKKCDILCVNNFVHSDYFEILKPEDYVLLDGYYFLFDNQKYNRQDVYLTFEKFKIINWHINFYLPAIAKKSYLVNEYLGRNPFVHIYYFNHIVIEGYNWFKHFIFKKELGMPQSQNVLCASLFLSINKGYKDIYLFGADHSWHEKLSILDNNKISLEDVHFYDKKKVDPKLMQGFLESNINIADIFLSLYKLFRSYNIINNYANYRKVKIYNASHKSFIDAFEKIKINDK